MTPRQIKRFDKICSDMQELFEEIQKEHPHATLYIEDGCVSIIDWSPDIHRRPNETLADGTCWMFASGGGK